MRTPSLLLLLGLTLSVLLGAAPPEIQPASADPRTDAARDAWNRLPTTQNRCGTFDYFPQGGMQVFWCHLQELTTLKNLEDLAAAPIFLSGPHRGETLNLNNPSDFGHYNPVFVERMVSLLIPGAEDKTFRAATQTTYNTYVRPLAHIYWLTRLKLTGNPECQQRELSGYQAFIASRAAVGTSYHERWFFFMNPHFCKGQRAEEWYYTNGMDGGVDGNIAKGAVGFWLRRTMDGTDNAFAAGLSKLLRAYDAKWLAQPSKD